MYNSQNNVFFYSFILIIFQYLISRLRSIIKIIILLSISKNVLIIDIDYRDVIILHLNLAFKLNDIYFIKKNLNHVNTINFDISFRVIIFLWCLNLILKLKFQLFIKKLLVGRNLSFILINQFLEFFFFRICHFDEIAIIF